MPTSACTCGIHIPPQICRCSQFRSATSSTYSTKRSSTHLLSLHSVQQSCEITRGCAFRVTSMSNFFFVLAGCQHAKKEDVLVARSFLHKLGAELSRCSVPQAHQRIFHCCTRIFQTLECRTLQSLFLESTPSLRHSGRLRRHDPLAPIYFPPQIRPNSEEFRLDYWSRWILLLQTSQRLTGEYPRRPSPHHFISLTAVIERRHQYRVLLRVTTPICAFSDINCVAIFGGRLLKTKRTSTRTCPTGT